MPRRIWRSGGDLRRRLYEILEHGTIGDRTGLIVGRLIVVLIKPWSFMMRSSMRQHATNGACHQKLVGDAAENPFTQSAVPIAAGDD
jgi:hypothetical protein